MKRKIITKCYNCSLINLVGLRTCQLCEKRTCYQWTENGLNFSDLNPKVQALIIRRNQLAYGDFYQRSKQQMEMIHLKDVPIYIVESEYLKDVRRKLDDGTYEKYQKLVRSWVLYDKTETLIPYSKHENFDSMEELRNHIIKYLFGDYIHEITQFYLTRTNSPINDDTKKRFRLRIGEWIVFRRTVPNKLLIFLKPKILGELEFVKLNDLIMEVDYKNIFEKINKINNIYTSVRLSEDEIEKGADDLYKYVMSLDGEEVDLL